MKEHIYKLPTKGTVSCKRDPLGMIVSSSSGMHLCLPEGLSGAWSERRVALLMCKVHDMAVRSTKRQLKEQAKKSLSKALVK
jgi:hypothetical protein